MHVKRKLAGLPEGVLNPAMGKGPVVRQAMLDSAEVDAISFTGSVATGQRIAEASFRQMREIQLEMGGKNPMVVLDDADPDTAVEAGVDSAYISTGQCCAASSRLVVTSGTHGRFVEATVERLNRATPGFCLSPARFTEAPSQMRIGREETFGPVANVVRVKDCDEAPDLANDAPFGPTAGICTTPLKHAEHFRRNAEAGMVMVNLPTAGVDSAGVDSHVPFGDTKGSSCGPRERGRYAAEFHTTVKTACTKP